MELSIQWQSHLNYAILRCINVLNNNNNNNVWAAGPRLLPGSGPAEIQTYITRILLGHEPMLCHYTTQATNKLVV